MDIILTIIGVSVVIVGILLGYTIAERYCLKKLKKAKAISQKSAITPKEAKIDSGPLTDGALARLVRRKKVKVIEDGRYYVECKDKKHC